MSEKKKHEGDKNPEISKAAKELGHRGGLKGGKARAKALTPEQRSEIARLGGLAHKSKQGVRGKAKAEGEDKHRRGEDHKKHKGDSK